MHDADVIVVGGGIAGLVAAAFALKAGSRVMVLEGASTFGGRGRTRTISGFRFNQGAHALNGDGPLDRVLHELGISLPGGAPPLDAGVFVSAGRLHRAPFGRAGLVATTLLDDAEKREIATVLGRLFTGRAPCRPGTTLRQALDDLSGHPKVRAALGAMVRFTSVVHAPDTADGTALLDQLRGALIRDARHVDGGWQTLINALRTTCIERGGALRSRSPVASVARDTGWHATLRNGVIVTAPAVVLAVPPSRAAALCPAVGVVLPAGDPLPARAACLDLGLTGLPRPDILFALDVDRPLYFSVHSATARLAPGNGALVHAMRFIEPGETPDRQKLVGELEAFVDLLQPGWRDRVVVRRFLGAMPVHSALPLAAHRGLSGRPGAPVPDADGLFIAGDWVGPDGLLADASAASGRAAGLAAADSAGSRPNLR